MARDTQRSAAVHRAAFAAGPSLPPWFTANRVHGHTRLTLSTWKDTEEWVGAASGFKWLGAHAFTRHAKTGGEDPWWESGEPPPPNVVKDFIDSAHAAGLRIFTYYWHMSQTSLERPPHENWVCKSWSGSPIKARPGAHYLDITGPYGDVVLARLRDLAVMGADGLFFDARHLPPRGCWGTALEEDWRRLTGQPAPRPIPASRLYQQFLDFKAKRIEETFIRWRDEIKAAHPNVVFVISTTVVPALTDREMTTRLARLADSAKNEYEHAIDDEYNKSVFDDPDLRKPVKHVRQALGWTVLRDASNGRPPHIWAKGVPNAEHAQAFAASLLTFGCIANMDVFEHGLVVKDKSEPTPRGKTPIGALKAAFALGKTVSPHMAGTQLVRWVALHYSEQIRDSYRHRFGDAWRGVLWPLVEAYEVLSVAGVPVGIVNDQQLEEGALEGYRVLVLPKAGGLTAAQQQAVTAFRDGGGTVIENNPAWAWSDPTQGDTAAAAFRAVVGPYIRWAPVQVIGGPAGRYAVSYQRPWQWWWR